MSDAAVARDASLVSVRDESGVRTVMLNRPDRHNALIPELLSDLRAAIARAEADGAGCLLLAARGRSFSTGGDVAEFAAREGAALVAYAEQVVGELNEAILDLLRLAIPVVTAVHGPVTGGSLGLVLASDLSIGGPDAWFQPFYTEVGFSPDGGWAALLPERVGRARALAWQLNNERISSPAAHAAGLLTHYHEDPLERGAEIARELAAHPPGSLRRTKKLLAPDHARINAALERERQEFIQQIATDEARRGMTKFLTAPPTRKEPDENP